MSPVLYLAWRYLAHHRVKTAILIVSILLIVYLPVGLHVLVKQSERELTTRAEATPLIVGAKGSPLELVLNSLYFESDTPAILRHGEVARVSATGLARAIPLYTRFHVRGHTIVGTSIDYFGFRTLQISEGRALAVIGECVLGAEVARRLGAVPGDHVISSPESVFDLAGVYPLKMEVVGILSRAHTPDDEAIFVDVKTTWIISGLAHGHQDMAAPDAAPGVLRREGTNIVANASVLQYNEVTPDNIDSFHFHGDPNTFPITAVIAVPHDAKSSALLQGRYLGDDELVQIVRPIEVMDELLQTILTVQSFVVTAVVIVGLATLATATLVFMLSLRLRRREIETMVKIGGSRASIFAVLATEIVAVLLIGIALAGGLTALTAAFGSTLIRALILS